MLPKSTQDYSLDIHIPSLSVLLTPCCTLRHRMFTLAPLMPIRNSFFENPYFREDLTRINRPMEPRQTVAPELWNNFPDEEKVRRSQEGIAYAFVEIFVYQENEVFEECDINLRNLGRQSTRFHMIDFRHLYKLSGEDIKNAEAVLLEAKVLQLSIAARTALREKISHYFGRTPQEDQMVEDE